MSLFSWLFPKPKPAAARAQPAPSAHAPLAAGGPRPEGRAHPGAPQAGSAPEAGGARKNERMERREQLYAVVRDVMVRAGVLSAGYKFKVLSLDQRGAQFLVMVDLAPEYSLEPLRSNEIEALIVQTARARCDILITSVYWRINQQLGSRPSPVPRPTPGVATVPAPEVSSPVLGAQAQMPARPAAVRPPWAGAASRPAPLVPPQPGQRPVPPPQFDPIEPDEVAAFKQALASAAAARPTPLAPPEPGITTRSGPLLPPSPGFEDTLLPGQDSRSSGDLSTTQYGDLD
ncbi:hypothetical protein [Pulveribacter suum]|uniref:Uncharacterized protein n=1 Tax=Pulveribacter suum TaxID=2116657 RepID=A0A2P1NH24_9BURK|nr:hypothetical protein [Pulveribacter suum]AVP56322.1 hypothetical protein C7H73_00665 [Pulveribacter suum]